ncbi:MAG TPA: DoxX family protein [Candidatus Binatia bacterium]|nr:DoxX family protein [Candidatus Binatia bacterium]
MWWMQLLTASLLAALFLQSGMDKVSDREGNVSWLREHFKSSPLAGRVETSVTIITVLELAAGVFSALGALAILLWGGRSFAYAGAVLSAITILFLFVGQRLAKDYAGAAVLVNYFLLSMLAVWVMR